MSSTEESRGPGLLARIGTKRLALVLVAVIIGLGGAAYGHSWWTHGRFTESTDDAYVGGDVTVIAPKVAGFVEQVLVTDNQAVHAGDLLVKLDDRDYRTAYANALAAVEVREASLANIEATRHLQQSKIAEVDADIAAAGAEIVRSRDDEARYQQLIQARAASVQNLQSAQATYKVALATDQRARASLAAARQQVNVIDTQRMQAQAALTQAIADRDVARLNLSYTELRAPIDGVIGNRSARTGAFASVGSRLMAVVPARGLWVDANFKETQLARMQPGLAVSVKADVMPGRVFHGHIESVAPATGAQFSVLPAENATGNFTRIVQRVPVRIALEGDGAVLGNLRPGLSVKAEVDARPVDQNQRLVGRVDPVR